jgi:hypothetical protein
MAQKLTPEQQDAAVQRVSAPHQSCDGIIADGAELHPRHKQYRAEVAQQTLQDMVEKMTNACFAKCAGKSGTHLDSRVSPPV